MGWDWGLLANGAAFGRTRTGGHLHHAGKTERRQVQEQMEHLPERKRKSGWSRRGGKCPKKCGTSVPLLA